MKSILITIAFICIAGCNATLPVDVPAHEGIPTAEATFSTSAATPSPANEESPKVNCQNPDEYDVFVVDEGRRTVNVTISGKLLRAIEVPRQMDTGMSGFSLNWAKKTKSGFEISIEYGSRYYYNKRLMFECQKDGFYLTSIEVESHDQANPEKGTVKSLRVKPTVPLVKFDVMDYTHQ